MVTNLKFCFCQNSLHLSTLLWEIYATTLLQCFFSFSLKAKASSPVSIGIPLIANAIILSPIYSSSTFCRQSYTFFSKTPRKSQEICKLSANYHKTCTSIILSTFSKAVQARTNLAQGFDASPTLERSGSEHRRAVTSSRSWGKRGLERKVEPSLRVRKDG